MKHKMLRLTFLIVGCVVFGSRFSWAQTVEYYHLDALGSVRAVTNQSGAVIERHDYLPFGEELTPPVGAQPRQFTGKERDAETGMDYFGARYFSAETARFTTIDPVFTYEENLVDPQRWNRYAYVRDNPLRYTDPDGRALDTLWDIGNLVYDVYTGFKTGSWTDFKTDLVFAAIPFVPAGVSKIRYVTKLDDAARAVDKAGDVGRAGKQARLRELADDANVSSADRGWIKQEMNQIERGKRTNIRNPPGKDLAHERGREAAKGYDYSNSNLQDRSLHKTQHKYDDYGRANKERPKQ